MVGVTMKNELSGKDLMEKHFFYFRAKSMYIQWCFNF